jgi:hypothetical protein
LLDHKNIANTEIIQKTINDLIQNKRNPEDVLSHYQILIQISPERLLKFISVNRSLLIDLTKISENRCTDSEFEYFIKTCAFFRLSKEHQEIASECLDLDDLDLETIKTIEENE